MIIRRIMQPYYRFEKLDKSLIIIITKNIKAQKIRIYNYVASSNTEGEREKLGYKNEQTSLQGDYTIHVTLLIQHIYIHNFTF